MIVGMNLVKPTGRPPELATQEGRYRLRPRHPHRHTDLAPCCGGTLVSAALRRRQPVPPYLSPSCVSNNIKWLMNYLTAHDVSTCSACRAHVPLNHPIGDTGAVLGPGHPACLDFWGVLQHDTGCFTTQSVSCRNTFPKNHVLHIKM